MASSSIYEKDLYQILGVSKSDSAATIKKRYRALARELHPDKTKGDKKLEERFKEVSESYEILSDEKKRKDYDEMREAIAAGRVPRGGFGGANSYQTTDFSQFFNGGGGQGGFSASFGGGDPQDIFSTLFGGGRRVQRGADLETQATISFRESVFGKELTLNLKSKHNSNNSITTRIPAGIKDGARIRIKGRGAVGEGGNGDLYITVHVEKHPIFSRDELNLLINLPITFNEATLGADIKVPTIDQDEVTLRLPAGTSSGKTFRVKGRGIKTNKAVGDLLVTVTIQTPQKLNARSKELLNELAKEIDQGDLRSDFLKKAKN